jgi:hypothetical protein
MTMLTSAMHRPGPGPIIADRTEFIEALHQLLHGHVLVRVSEDSWGCQLNGAPLRRSFGTLLRYGLIAPIHNPRGFAGVGYYRITEAGRAFARRALDSWRALPLWQRTLMRLTG